MQTVENDSSSLPAQNFEEREDEVDIYRNSWNSPQVGSDGIEHSQPLTATVDDSENEELDLDDKDETKQGSTDPSHAAQQVGNEESPNHVSLEAVEPTSEVEQLEQAETATEPFVSEPGKDQETQSNDASAKESVEKSEEESSSEDLEAGSSTESEKSTESSASGVSSTAITSTISSGNGREYDKTSQFSDIDDAAGESAQYRIHVDGKDLVLDKRIPPPAFRQEVFSRLPRPIVGEELNWGVEKLTVHVRLRPLDDIDLLQDSMAVYYCENPSNVVNNEASKEREEKLKKRASGGSISFQVIEDLSSLPLRTADIYRRERAKLRRRRFQVSGRCFDEMTPNSGFYEGTVQPAVFKSTEGINTAVLCAGLPGSGKAHTVFGTAERPGLIAQAVADLFHHIQSYGNPHDNAFKVLGATHYAQRSSVVWKALQAGNRDAGSNLHHKEKVHFFVRLSFLGISEKGLRDLLVDLKKEEGALSSDCSTPVNLTIKEKIDGSPFGATFEVEHLSEIPLTQASQALSILARFILMWRRKRREERAHGRHHASVTVVTLRVERVVVLLKPPIKRRAGGGVGKIQTFQGQVDVLQRTEGSVAFVICNDTEEFGHLALAYSDSTLTPNERAGVAGTHQLRQILTHIARNPEKPTRILLDQDIKETYLTQILSNYLFNRGVVMFLLFINPSLSYTAPNGNLLAFVQEIGTIQLSCSTWHTGWASTSAYCTGILRRLEKLSTERQMLLEQRTPDTTQIKLCTVQMEALTSLVCCVGWRFWSALQCQRLIEPRAIFQSCGLLESRLRKATGRVALDLAPSPDLITSKKTRKEGKGKSARPTAESSAGTVHPTIARHIRLLQEQQKALEERMTAMSGKGGSTHKHFNKSRYLRLSSSSTSTLSLPNDEKPPKSCSVVPMQASHKNGTKQDPIPRYLSFPTSDSLNFFEQLSEEAPAAERHQRHKMSGNHRISGPGYRLYAEGKPPPVIPVTQPTFGPSCAFNDIFQYAETPAMVDVDIAESPYGRDVASGKGISKDSRNPIEDFLLAFVDKQERHDAAEQDAKGYSQERRNAPYKNKNTKPSSKSHHGRNDVLNWRTSRYRALSKQSKKRSKTRRTSQDTSSRSSSSTSHFSRSSVSGSARSQKSTRKSSRKSVRSTLAQQRPTMAATGQLQIERDPPIPGVSGFGSAVPSYGGLLGPVQFPMGGNAITPNLVGGLPPYLPIKPTLEQHMAPAGLPLFAGFQYPPAPKEPKPIVVHLHQHGERKKDGDLESRSVIVEKKEHLSVPKPTSSANESLSDTQAVGLATAVAVQGATNDKATLAGPPEPHVFTSPFAGGVMPNSGVLSPSHVRFGFEGAVNVDPSLLCKKRWGRRRRDSSYSSTFSSASEKSSYESIATDHSNSPRSKRRHRRSRKPGKKTSSRQGKKRTFGISDTEVSGEKKDSKLRISEEKKRDTPGFLIRKERRALARKLLQQLYYDPGGLGHVVERTLQDFLPLLRPQERSKLLTVIEDYHERRGLPKRVASFSSRVQNGCENGTFSGLREKRYQPPYVTDYEEPKCIRPHDLSGFPPVSYLSSDSTESLSSIRSHALMREIRQNDLVHRKRHRAVLRGDVGTDHDRTTACEEAGLRRYLDKITDQDVLQRSRNATKSLQNIRQSLGLHDTSFSNASSTSHINHSYSSVYDEPLHKDRIRQDTDRDRAADGSSTLDPYNFGKLNSSPREPRTSGFSGSSEDLNTSTLHSTARSLQRDLHGLLHRLDGEISLETFGRSQTADTPSFGRSTNNTRSNSNWGGIEKGCRDTAGDTVDDPSATFPRIHVTASPILPAPYIPPTSAEADMSRLRVPLPGQTAPVPMRNDYSKAARVPPEPLVSVGVKGTGSVEAAPGSSGVWMDTLSTQLTGQQPWLMPTPALFQAPESGHPASFIQPSAHDRHETPDYVGEIRLPRDEEASRKLGAPPTFLPPPQRRPLPPDAGSPLPLSSLAFGGAEANEKNTVVTQYPSGQPHFQTIKQQPHPVLDANKKNQCNKSLSRFEEPAINWETFGMLAGTEDISAQQRLWQESLRPFLDRPWRVRVRETWDSMQKRLSKKMDKAKKIYERNLEEQERHSSQETVQQDVGPSEENDPSRQSVLNLSDDGTTGMVGENASIENVLSQEDQANVSSNVLEKAASSLDLPKTNEFGDTALASSVSQGDASGPSSILSDVVTSAIKAATIAPERPVPIISQATHKTSVKRNTPSHLGSKEYVLSDWDVIEGINPMNERKLDNQRSLGLSFALMRKQTERSPSGERIPCSFTFRPNADSTNGIASSPLVSTPASSPDVLQVNVERVEKSESRSNMERSQNTTKAIQALDGGNSITPDSLSRPALLEGHTFESSPKLGFSSSSAQVFSNLNVYSSPLGRPGSDSGDLPPSTDTPSFTKETKTPRQSCDFFSNESSNSMIGVTSDTPDFTTEQSHLERASSRFVKDGSVDSNYQLLARDSPKSSHNSEAEDLEKYSEATEHKSTQKEGGSGMPYPKLESSLLPSSTFASLKTGSQDNFHYKSPRESLFLAKLDQTSIGSPRLLSCLSTKQFSPIAAHSVSSPEHKREASKQLSQVSCFSPESGAESMQPTSKLIAPSNVLLPVLEKFNGALSVVTSLFPASSPRRYVATPIYSSAPDIQECSDILKVHCEALLKCTPQINIAAPETDPPIEASTNDCAHHSQSFNAPSDIKPLHSSRIPHPMQVSVASSMTTALNDVSTFRPAIVEPRPLAIFRCRRTSRSRS